MTVWIAVRRRCFRPTLRPVSVCDNLINALRLLANQQTVEVLVESLQERSRLKMTEMLRMSIMVVLRPLTAACRSARPFSKHKKVDFSSTSFAPVQLAPDVQNTGRALMTRPPVAECLDETTCLRQRATKYPPTRHDRKQDTPANTSTDVSQPETCDEQTRNEKPLLQHNQERTIRNTTDTMEGPEATTTTPLARDKQHI